MKRKLLVIDTSVMVKWANSQNENDLNQAYKVLINAEKKKVELLAPELAKYEILHKNSKGINVIVKFNNEKEKQEIIDYCKSNNYEYTLCPKTIRVLDTAISIEVKRINQQR